MPSGFAILVLITWRAFKARFGLSPKEFRDASVGCQESSALSPLTWSPRQMEFLPTVAFSTVP